VLANFVRRVGGVINHKLSDFEKNRFYRTLSTRETFDHIYKNQLWGSKDGHAFCSGDGSYREDAVSPYAEIVRTFIATHKVRSVLDLGCGDFNVGSRIVSSDIRYTGVDVVPVLIEYNQSHFGSESIQFRCLDILQDPLPEADLCLVRQVLQHLSNKQIKAAVSTLSKFPYVIVTEHVYSGEGLKPNLDKGKGPGTRIPRKSGIFLEAKPFRIPAELLLGVPLQQNETLRTVLISHVH
jgi:SAM-dependent methyltransferase